MPLIYFTVISVTRYTIDQSIGKSTRVHNVYKICRMKYKKIENNVYINGRKTVVVDGDVRFWLDVVVLYTTCTNASYYINTSVVFDLQIHARMYL